MQGAVFCFFFMGLKKSEIQGTQSPGVVKCKSDLDFSFICLSL